MNQRELTFDNGVATKVTQLLERVAKLTTADKLKPTTFDAHGEAAARVIAAAERAGVEVSHARSRGFARGGKPGKYLAEIFQGTSPDFPPVAKLATEATFDLVRP